jgi:16S rRNA (uracil1498-N3)-methyltransferase
VLRLQPGSEITLFNGEGGEWRATVTRMGRSEVQVQLVAHEAVEREAPREVHLAIGMPANERMDWLVEKATELGAASLQPLQAERSVLRLAADRAQKKRSHWQGVAAAACEQCGRNRVPAVHAVQTLADWLASPLPAQRLLLSLQPDSMALAHHPAMRAGAPVVFLSGPEGGLSTAEEQAARAAGFAPVSLGTRTLRAETAPLAALAALTLAP